MEDIKVSVIIPVYNTEKYIEQCVRSILNQTLKEIEIICIDDGSSDQSLNILNEIAKEDKRLIVLAQQNGGQSVARNAGMQIAKGKYVYFMDSDDFLSSYTLEELWEKCEEEKLDLIYFSGTSFYDTVELEEAHKVFKNNYYRTGEYTEVKTGRKLMTDIFNNGDYSVSPCLQMIRREHLTEQNITFCEGIIHEDNCFSFQVAMTAQRAFCVNDVYFYRRIREDSVMTTEDNERNMRGYYVCLLKELEFMRTIQVDEADVIDIVEKILYRLTFHVQRIYMLIDADAKQAFLDSCTFEEKLYFESIFRYYINLNNEKNRKIKKQKKEIKKIKSSNSYRIGRVVTAPVRWAKAGVKCFKKAGFIYMCKRFIKKITRK